MIWKNKTIPTTNRPTSAADKIQTDCLSVFLSFFQVVHQSPPESPSLEDTIWLELKLTELSDSHMKKKKIMWASDELNMLCVMPPSLYSGWNGTVQKSYCENRYKAYFKAYKDKIIIFEE